MLHILEDDGAKLMIFNEKNKWRFCTCFGLLMAAGGVCVLLFVEGGGIDLGGVLLETARDVAEGFGELVVVGGREALPGSVGHGAVDFLREPCLRLVEILLGKLRFVDKAVELEKGYPCGLRFNFYLLCAAECGVAHLLKCDFFVFHIFFVNLPPSLTRGLIVNCR